VALLWHGRNHSPCHLLVPGLGSGSRRRRRTWRKRRESRRRGRGRDRDRVASGRDLLLLGQAAMFTHSFMHHMRVQLMVL
jgi:hypothetical protein